ncbi:MAG: PAS domain S-box protein [Methanomicrobiaceae archaeon]|uniref:Sensory box histidine kinase n=1 Tax=hydrocarbon metagenome TaxID=938273 RepID=A0A0W8FFH8_9ZZZZ|nr:PAS domain S-box protein [Methanomicrobiaceae archaeon]
MSTPPGTTQKKSDPVSKNEGSQDISEEVERLVLERTRELQKENDAFRDRNLGLQSAVAALRESEERYRAMVERSPDAIVVHDLEGRLLYANPAALRLTGVQSIHDLGGRSVFSTLPAEMLDTVSEGMSKLVQGESLPPISMPMQLPDGRRIHVDVTAALTAYEGNPAIQAVLKDITARRQAEETLRESEERFTAFMDNSPAMAWMKDEEGRYVYMNRSFGDRLNVRLADWQGKTDFELWPPHVAGQFRENDRAVLERDRAIEFVEETPNPEGGATYWLNCKFPFKDASGRKYVGGIGIDITARRQAEEQLAYQARLLSHIHDVIIGTDASFRITMWNPAAERLYGWTADEAMGKPVYEVIRSDFSSEQLAESLHMLHETGEYRVEIRQYQRDGTPIEVEGVTIPLFGENGRVTGYLALNRDITERKRAEETLKEREEQLRNLIECSGDGIVLTDETGRIITWNQGMETITGLAAKDVLGKPGCEIQLRVVNTEWADPDHQTRYRAVWDRICGTASIRTTIVSRKCRPAPSRERPGTSSREYSPSPPPGDTAQGVLCGMSPSGGVRSSRSLRAKRIIAGCTCNWRPRIWRRTSISISSPTTSATPRTSQASMPNCSPTCLTERRPDT